jgi:hypothetical protein
VGEPGVFASLQENPVQLERMIHGFGWNAEEPGWRRHPEHLDHLIVDV